MQRVLIVGGGSAGWLTACYMDALLNGPGGRRVAFTVLESPSIGRIGVGEATIPSMRETLRRIGIDEPGFMKAASATCKQGILFRDWSAPGESYFHPFDRFQSGAYFDQAGTKWILGSDPPAFADMVSAQPALAARHLSPKRPGDRDYQGAFPYAYHMDAELFADHLACIGRARGIAHIRDDVVDVDIGSDGTIAGVRTAQGETVSADLYIDCTGFAALLSRQALNAPFRDYGQWLLCDRAVALRIPDPEPAPDVRPFTTATALSAGWRWDIGLSDRRGLGYVYSSAFISDDEAAAELKASLGTEAEGIEPRRLAFRTGCCLEPWTRNCVAIGLSSGFIEPLESTGLYLVELAAHLLVEHFPSGAEMRPLAAKFNRLIVDRYEEILDFVALHYCLTKRTDTPFWREVVKDERRPARLQALLELWEYKPPTISDFPDSMQAFNEKNWEYILFGMGWRPRSLAGDARRLDTRIPPQIEGAVAHLSGQLIGHKDYLAAVARPG
jgi:tryptophan 7-halogenase